MEKIKNGDILNAKETIIAHAVNCQGVVDGLATDIFRRYPYAKKDYTDITTRLPGKILLGIAYYSGMQRDGHIICNLFGRVRPDEACILNRLEQALEQLASFAKTMGVSVALPYDLGCGADQDKVMEIVEQTMAGVEYVVYRKGDPR